MSCAYDEQLGMNIDVLVLVRDWALLPEYVSLRLGNQTDPYIMSTDFIENRHDILLTK